MKLHEIKPDEGSRHSLKRKGRGIGSGLGKTAGKGHKGQRARSGGGKGPAFEGGQTPIIRRLPKRGFSNARFKTTLVAINVSVLDRFEANTEVTPALLKQAGIVKQMKDGIKILGTGEITKPLTVKVHAISQTAKEKIEAVGGKVEVM
ncbi:LSU ribosomal protein L15P [Desulfonispora thiosulfatigenes DSM 11270]|uniref:Large ribosomal subunit protein uL15 n=1 Tax=Desulfonispora thiosulfatigenes DSM 11270 TaxID=656914 RepID=A0A1W1URT8_DESTI|nr:50S ribosomal protein L15 [Desulfonispora thiosulfatigenes]SMB83790.1 LSU ribosomal protein L15P [Desulfonispora thiosulfatigenes DSM 11270]